MTKQAGLLGWVILLGIGLTWGSSYLLIKKALVHHHFADVGSLRMLMAALFFSPWLPGSLKKISRKDLLPLTIVAFCGSGVPAVLFPLAQTQIGSGLAGIMSSTTPLFTLLFAGILFKIPLTRFKVIGICTGFAGTLLLVVGSNSGEFEGSAGHASIILVATSLYAISSNTVNKNLSHLSSLNISSVAFALLTLPSITVLLFRHQSIDSFLYTIYFESFIPLLILAFAGTFLATFLFFQLIKMEGVIFSSTVSYIIPLIALLLALMDGELLNLMHLAGMVTILAGVYLCSFKR